MNDKEFTNFKKQVLLNPDASKKGGVDERIKPVMDLINARDNYVTLSSCSGRTAVVVQPYEGKIRKEGCQWAYSCHDFVDAEELIDCIHKSMSEGLLTLQFEPFILHVACQGFEDAQIMLNCALSAGCKNSGLVVGKRGRYTVAARNTLRMDIPLNDSRSLLVSEEYIKFVADQANGKMKTNLEKLQKFEKCIRDL